MYRKSKSWQVQKNECLTLSNWFYIEILYAKQIENQKFQIKRNEKISDYNVTQLDFIAWSWCN